MVDRSMASKRKRDAAAAEIEAPGADKRARRTPRADREDSVDWGGISDTELLELAGQDPGAAPPTDRPSPVAPRDDAPGNASLASDDEYGSFPDLFDYQFETPEKDLPVEDEQQLRYPRGHMLSPEYQEGLCQKFRTAGKAEGVHRPPQSKQFSLLDRPSDWELLVAGKPDPVTGGCRLFNQKQHTQASGRKFAERNGEKVNETLDDKTLFFRSLDGRCSIQPVPVFLKTGDPRFSERRLKKYGVSLKQPAEPGPLRDGSLHPPLVIRTTETGKSMTRGAKKDTEPNFTATWPHRDGIVSLTDLIKKYGEKNIWLKTKDNIYKNPIEYNLTEPDSAFRTFALMAGAPIAWVKTAEDCYVDRKTYRAQDANAARRKDLDALVLTRDGDSLVSPARLKDLEPETYEETMHMAGLSAALTDVISKPASVSPTIELGDQRFVQAQGPDGNFSGDFIRETGLRAHERPPVSIADDNGRAAESSEPNSQAVLSHGPATSAVRPQLDPRENGHEAVVGR